MVVFILERVPATVRGEMSRWLIEPRHGVFLGDISAMVRDRLWTAVTEKVGKGGALLVYSAANEQGFKVRAVGDTTRSMRECEGLLLVHIPTEMAKKKTTPRGTVRFSPDASPTPPQTDGTTRPWERPSSPSVSKARSSPRPRWWPRKTIPLYEPPSADEIALYRADNRDSEPGEEVVSWYVGGQGRAPESVGFRWRPVVVDPFAE
jgi:CRISPR-associated protein Cas2